MVTMTETQRNFECVEAVDTMSSSGFNHVEVLKECANCCSSLAPAPADIESEDVLLGKTEMNFNGTIISVKIALCEIFKLGDLTALGDEPLPEMIPLCPSCIPVLADLYKLYDMFRSLRKMESYMATKIGRLDEIIRRNGSNSILNREDVGVSEVAIAIREEPIDCDYDDLNETMSSPEAEEFERSIVFPEKGPWVKLVRLRPEDIPNAPVLPSEEGTSESSSISGSEADIISYEFGNGDTDSGLRRYSKRKTSEDDIVVLGAKSNRQTGRVMKMKKSDIAKETKKRKIRTTWTTKKKRGQVPNKTTKNKEQILHKKNPVDKSKFDSTTKKATKSDTNGAAEGTHNANIFTSSYDKINVLSEFWTDFLCRKDKIPFPCFHCKEDFHTETERLNHMKSAHQEYEFPCSACGKGFKSKPGYTEHFPRCGHIPDNVHLPPYICDTCGKEFPKYRLLYVHKKTMHIPATLPCDECNFVARTKNFLRTHKETVHSKEPAIKCHICEKLCRTQHSFKQHFRTKHTEEGHKKYKISVAKKAEKVRAKRRAAYAAAAARFTTSVCQYCHVDFQTITRVRRHTLNVHEPHRKTKICELCGKGFINADKLKRHQTAAHSDARPFVCDICGRCYKTRDNLTMHNRITHDEEGKKKYNEYMRQSSKLRAKIAQSRASSVVGGQNSTETVQDDSEVDNGNNGHSQVPTNNINPGLLATGRGSMSTTSSEDGSGYSGTGLPTWNPLPLLVFHNN